MAERQLCYSRDLTSVSSCDLFLLSTPITLVLSRREVKACLIDGPLYDHSVSHLTAYCRWRTYLTPAFSYSLAELIRCRIIKLILLFCELNEFRSSQFYFSISCTRRCEAQCIPELHHSSTGRAGDNTRLLIHVHKASKCKGENKSADTSQCSSIGTYTRLVGGVITRAG